MFNKSNRFNRFKMPYFRVFSGWQAKKSAAIADRGFPTNCLTLTYFNFSLIAFDSAS